MVNDIGHLGATVSMNIDPFQRSIKTLEAQQRALKASMKATDAVFTGQGRTVQALGVKYKLLLAQMKSQKQIVDSLKKSYEEKALALKNNANASEKEIQNVAKAERRYMLAEAELIKMNRTLQQTGRDLRQQGSAFIQAGRKVDAYGQKIQSIGGGISKVGGSVTRNFSAPVAIGMGLAVKSAADFEAQLSSIQAVSGATNQEMAQLEKLAVDMGAKTKYSSLEAAQGIEELMKAGVSTSDIMNGGLAASLDLATAGELDLKDAAEIASTALNAFKSENLSVRDAANLLAGGANASATSVSGLQMGLAQSAAVASSAGLSFNDTATALSVFANNGLKGSDAGTSLKTMLLTLQPQSDSAAEAMKRLGIITKDGSNQFYDSKGKVKSFAEISEVLKNSLEGLTPAQQQSALKAIFGSDAYRAASIAAREGADGVNQMNGEMKKTTAADVAAKKMDNLKGKIEEMKGALETMGISLGQAVIPLLSDGVKWLQQMIDKFNDLDPSTQKFIAKALLLSAVLGPLTIFVGNFVKSLGFLTSGMGKTLRGIGLLTSKLTAAKQPLIDLDLGTGKASKGLTKMDKSAGVARKGVGLFGLSLNPVGLGIAGVGVALAGGVFAWEKWGKSAVESAKRTNKWGTDVGGSADKALSKMKNYSDKTSDSLQSLDQVSSESAKKVSANMDKMVSAVSKADNAKLDKLKQEIEKLPKDMRANAQKALDTEKKQGAERVKLAENAASTVNAITLKHAKDGTKLTNEEYLLRINSQKELLALEVNQMDLSGKEKKSVLQAMENDFTKMTQAQYDERITALGKANAEEEKEFGKQKEALKKIYGDSAEYDTEYTKLKEKHAARRMEYAIAEVNGYENFGVKHEVVQKQLEENLKRYGLTYDQVAKEIDKRAQAIAKSDDRIAKSSGKMTDETVKANQMWNAMIFNPKDGKVKTNAKQVVAESMKSKDGWNNMMFMLKNARLSSNAKSIVLTGIIENNKWNSLTFEQKQMLAAYKGAPEVIKALNDIDKWQTLSAKQQQLIAKAKTKTELKKALKDMGLWDKLPEKIKKMLAESKDVKKKTKDGKKDIDSYNKKDPKKKKFTSSAPGAKETKKQLSAVEKQWKSIKSGTKTLNVVTHYTEKGKKQKKNGVGTNHFQGGAAILGDAAKREPFLTPDGYFGISPNTDTPMALPKGTRIWSSMARFHQHQALKGSRFMQAVSNLGPRSRIKESSQRINFEPNITIEANQETQDRQIQALEKSNLQQEKMISLLLRIASQNKELDYKAFEQVASQVSADRMIRESYGRGGAS